MMSKEQLERPIPKSLLHILDPHGFYTNSTKKRNCIPEAEELMRKNNYNGTIFWVYKIGEVNVNHAYYIPDLSKVDELALNQADNGFEGFPQLTVQQVLKYGGLICSPPLKNKKINFLSSYDFI